MRHLFFGIALLITSLLKAGTFTLHVTVQGFRDDVVSLYRYSDLFTLRTELVTRGMLDQTGKATLTGEVEGTARMQLRIGERFADLFVRPGSVLNLSPYDLGTARSLSGTTHMGLDFKEIDPLDVNALVSDLNERIDAFIAKDLATDEAAGMQVLDIQRKEGSTKRDTAARPATLFVTPVLSKAKVDPFALKLRNFYKDVHDPWFAHYLDNGIAGLYVGPRMHERELFNAFVKGEPVLYDDPEYVRLIRNLFTDALEQLHRYKGDSLENLAASGDATALRKLFQGNDFLRTDDRLAELVMIDQLYLNHKSPMVSKKDSEGILADVSTRSTYPEHRTIATNMLWDLTLMRVGSHLPEMRLENERGEAVELSELLKGSVCVAFTAGWCTYCASEISSTIRLADEYKGVVKVVIISLDGSIDEFKAARKSMPASEHVTWVHAVAEQQLREDLRLRSLPAFYLLNDDVLARSPAPLPSKGLGELFFKAKAEAVKGQREKVWDE
jgi:thiol-disulfide isomerase/thioredoxin